MTTVESSATAAPRSFIKPAASNRKKEGRLTFLDWTRGLAVVIMLQGHVFHSFNRTDLRTGGPFTLSQLMGGIGPAIFLVLTGITLAFLMDGRERQGLGAWDRWKASLRRAGYLFSLAFLFRLQLWLFAFPQSWKALFKVDILDEYHRSGCVDVGDGDFHNGGAGEVVRRIGSRYRGGLATGVVHRLEVAAGEFGLFCSQLSIFRILSLGGICRVWDQYRESLAAGEERTDASGNASGARCWASA